MGDYFFWCGVAVNAVGALGILALALWQIMEFWIKVNRMLGVLISFHKHQLRSKSGDIPG